MTRALSRLLCAVDFSPGSDDALTVAAAIAARKHADLVVMHALAATADAGGVCPPGGPGPSAPTADAELALDRAVRRAIEAGAEATSGRLVRATAAHGIVGLAEQARSELVVVGMRGRTGLSRLLLGSVATTVVRHAPCSVLAVPSGTPTRFARVLCPTDFSDSSHRAMELAAALVEPGGAITLLHVFGGPGTNGQTAAAAGLELGAMRLRSWTAAAVSARARTGHPGTEILAALDEDPGFDLVVMGSRGSTGLERLVLGSVAEKVVRNARRPVLVARRLSTRAR